MKRVAITQPIHLFLHYELWRDTLKTLHNDHYFRYVAASKVLSACAEIYNNEYHLLLGELFPADEKLEIALQSIAITAAYRNVHASTIEKAETLLKSVTDEPAGERRRVQKANVTLIFTNDQSIRSIVGYVKKLTFSSIADFTQIAAMVNTRNSQHQLLKPLELVLV
ncbi:MAG: hypothetical protein ABIO57_01440 [Candidatus Paceibacterota bacterium]